MPPAHIEISSQWTLADRAFKNPEQLDHHVRADFQTISGQCGENVSGWSTAFFSGYQENTLQVALSHSNHVCETEFRF
jgi:hypothetical protein